MLFVCNFTGTSLYTILPSASVLSTVKPATNLLMSGVLLNIVPSVEVGTEYQKK